MGIKQRFIYLFGMSTSVDTIDTIQSASHWIIAQAADFVSQDMHLDSSHSTNMLHTIFEVIVTVIDVMTVLVIVYGFVYAIYLFVQMHMDHLFGDKHTTVDLSVIRVKLGSYLLLALELFIAADIILTIGEPSLEHLLQLWAIIIIRVAISHFLQKEMNELTEWGIHH